MTKYFLFVFLTICLCSCAKTIQKDWAALGGSRADAIVEVAYLYNPDLEIPILSEAQGRKVAEERCRFWGFPEAEPFGMQTSKCNKYTTHFSVPACVEMLVTQNYQCLGRGDQATPLEKGKSN